MAKDCWGGGGRGQDRSREVGQRLIVSDGRDGVERESGCSDETAARGRGLRRRRIFGSSCHGRER